jgi:hypothetical protein
VIATSSAGGLGGVGSGGDVNVNGSPGSKGRVVSNLAMLTGAGGTSGLGYGGGAQPLSAVANGLPGLAYGGGGGGAFVVENGAGAGINRSGGAGAAGVVIITTYF